MDLGIPALTLKIMLESNPLKYRILVWRLAVVFASLSAHKSVWCFWLVCHSPRKAAFSELRLHGSSMES